MSAKNKTYMVYLVGAMSNLSFEEMNTWRVQVKHELMALANTKGYSLLVINPVDFYNFEEKIHQSEIEVEDFDLRMVTNSDFIIVNIKNLNTSIGSAIELHDAYFHNNIPVFAFGNIKEYEQLHPWIQRTITRRENTFHELIDYLRDFYFIT